MSQTYIFCSHNCHKIVIFIFEEVPVPYRKKFMPINHRDIVLIIQQIITEISKKSLSRIQGEKGVRISDPLLCFSLSFPDCRSSRSHTIFRIQLESANRLGDETTTSEDPDSSKEGRQVGGWRSFKGTRARSFADPGSGV
jgi:hypothetical protein